MIKFRKKKDKPEENFMLYIPRKRHTTWKVKNGKVFLVFHHTKFSEKFLRWLVKKPMVSDVELDELGSTVWLAIDGKKNIHELGKVLENTYGDKCNPVYDRLTLYMRHLTKKGWVSYSNVNSNANSNAKDKYKVCLTSKGK